MCLAFCVLSSYFKVSVAGYKILGFPLSTLLLLYGSRITQGFGKSAHVSINSSLRKPPDPPHKDLYRPTLGQGLLLCSCLSVNRIVLYSLSWPTTLCRPTRLVSTSRDAPDCVGCSEYRCANMPSLIHITQLHTAIFSPDAHPLQNKGKTIQFKEIFLHYSYWNKSRDCYILKLLCLSSITNNSSLFFKGLLHLFAYMKAAHESQSGQGQQASGLLVPHNTGPTCAEQALCQLATTLAPR